MSVANVLSTALDFLPDWPTCRLVGIACTAGRCWLDCCTLADDSDGQLGLGRGGLLHSQVVVQEREAPRKIT